MTAYELIQRLAQFPPNTKIVHAYNWEDDVELSDYTDIVPVGKLALSSLVSTTEADRVTLGWTPRSDRAYQAAV